jgi:MinD-like ATPase involved in chromosome partitioning or flagellar assembly
MTVLVFGSAKGSPGVTTTVLALAARWPEHREPFVVEADPAGGDMVARLASLEGNTAGLRDTPSTVQLAAASRRGLNSTTLLEHAQRLPGMGEVRALLSPASAFASTTALAELGNADLSGNLAALGGYDVLVDAGTILPASPMLAMVRSLRWLYVVARPTVESILHTRELVTAVGSMGVRCGVIVVGDRPYSPIDVVEATHTHLRGSLPFDPIGAAALAGQARSPKILGRSRLIRSAAVIASSLAEGPVAYETAQPIGVSR